MVIATATGPAGWAYNSVLFVHVLCAIVGFGAVMLNGIWGSALSKATGDAAATLATTLHKVSKIAEIFIYAVPVFGILVIVLSDEAHKFASPWISASFTLYVIALGLSLAVLQPSVKKLVSIAVEGNPATPERAALEKKVAAVSGVMHLTFVLILLLMVFGPTTTWLIAK